MGSPTPDREARPWGEFVTFTRNSPSTVKIITVRANESLSLQYHRNREEFWRVLSGTGTLEIDGKSMPAEVGTDYLVPREVKHRITAGSDGLVILEIATGTFDENDIVRLEDKYGRVQPV